MLIEVRGCGQFFAQLANYFFGGVGGAVQELNDFAVFSITLYGFRCVSVSGSLSVGAVSRRV